MENRGLVGMKGPCVRHNGKLPAPPLPPNGIINYAPYYLIIKYIKNYFAKFVLSGKNIYFNNLIRLILNYIIQHYKDNFTQK